MTMKDKRVLIIDDDAGIRSSLSRVIRASGYTVEVACDGLSAVEIAHRFYPDLLLIDIRMPGIDGVETFKQIRRDHPSIAAIFMTAFSASELAAEAESFGAISVLSKPLDLRSLIDLTKQAVANAPALIVDDEPSLLSSLTRVLHREGIDFETATSFEDAKRLLRQRPSRVVVADVFLADGSGPELLLHWCGDKENEPFILITGHREWLESEQAKLLGQKVICLSKPLDLSGLVNCIQKPT